MHLNLHLILHLNLVQIWICYKTRWFTNPIVLKLRTLLNLWLNSARLMKEKITPFLILHAVLDLQMAEKWNKIWNTKFEANFLQFSCIAFRNSHEIRWYLNRCFAIELKICLKIADQNIFFPKYVFTRIYKTFCNFVIIFNANCILVIRFNDGRLYTKIAS